MLSSAYPLLRIFPPPRFLLAPAVGLTISDHSIRFAELARAGRFLTLLRSGEMEVPGDVFTDGKIRDRDALKTALSEFRKKYRLRAAHIALPDEESYLFHTKIQGVPRREVRARLLGEIEQNVPLPKNEVLFDYQFARNASEEVSVTVLPAKTAAEYLSLFRESGFSPLSFELEAHALARALVSPRENGTRMLIDMGRTRTAVSIVSNGIVLFTATITMGGEALTSAVAKSFGLTFAEAREQKMRVGLKKTEQGADMVNALLPPLSTLRDEIKRYYSYWYSSAAPGKDGSSQKLEKILLSGVDAGIPGLPDYLRSSLKEKLSVANPWRNINPLSDYTPTLARNDALRYAVAFGLALRSF